MAFKLYLSFKLAFLVYYARVSTQLPSSSVAARAARVLTLLFEILQNERTVCLYGSSFHL